MRIVIFVLVFTCFNPLYATSSKIEDVFNVRPYLLYKSRDQRLLNVEVNRDMTLIIEFDEKALMRQSVVQKFKKNEMQRVLIRSKLCSISNTVNIYDDTRNLLHKLSFRDSCIEKDSSPSLEFLSIGDTQTFHKKHESVASSIVRNPDVRNSSFLLNTGDVVDYGNNYSEWLNFFKGADKYLGYFPLVAAIGNHDYARKKSYLLKKNPKYFRKFFRWNNDHSKNYVAINSEYFKLIVFDSIFEILNRKQQKEQWRWLKKQLSIAKEKGQIVALSLHYSPYSSAINTLGFSAAKLRKRLVPILEKYNNVPIVISGHTHIYERSVKKGIHYLVNGPAGGHAGRAVVYNHRKEAIAYKRTYTHYKVFRDYIELKTYTSDGEIIDQTDINLRSFTFR
ncbi:MAG: metallophosphoesterase [Bacteriovoracaceae bacterium]|nr:metallophosphoesterase [Bacteriovoracaceae bacterium]